MSDNMEIWDAVSKTNPTYTRRVNQRGGFTTINGHSQIMEATRKFGPIGIGWGYESGAPLFTETIVIIPITIWHGERTNRFGPIYGGAEIMTTGKDGKIRYDSDAPKKAGTDALTKGLSQLGFNADIFLGYYDDNKYVQQMQKEFEPEPDLITPQQIDKIKVLCPVAGVQPTTIVDAFKVKDMTKMTAEQGSSAIKKLNLTIDKNKQKDAA